MHSYGVHCVEWLSNALETIANERGTKEKDTGVCSMHAIRDSLLATLELSLHLPSLSPVSSSLVSSANSSVIHAMVCQNSWECTARHC